MAVTCFRYRPIHGHVTEYNLMYSGIQTLEFEMLKSFITNRETEKNKCFADPFSKSDHFFFSLGLQNLCV